MNIDTHNKYYNILNSEKERTVGRLHFVNTQRTKQKNQKQRGEFVNIATDENKNGEEGRAT